MRHIPLAIFTVFMAQKNTPTAAKKKSTATQAATAKSSPKGALEKTAKPAAKAAPKGSVKPAGKSPPKPAPKPKTARPSPSPVSKAASPSAKVAVPKAKKSAALPAPSATSAPSVALPAPAPVQASLPATAVPAFPPRRTFVKPNWQRRTGSVMTSDDLGASNSAVAAVPASFGGRPAHAQPRTPDSAADIRSAAVAPAVHAVPKLAPAAAHTPAERPPAPVRPALPPPAPEVLEYFTGILEFGRKENSEGRLRQLDGTYIADALDPVVGMHQIEKYNLRPGLKVKVSLGKPFGGGPSPYAGPHNGPFGKKNKGGSGRDALRIDPMARRVRDSVEVEGMPPETWAAGRDFNKLTIVMPEPRLALEYPGCPPACRFIDLFCPIGKGTRGMIVSPPKAGKTTLLQQIATALHKNHPQLEVFALLIDERPEEVTDFRRNVPVTVWASSNDHPPEKHVGLAIAAIERCKRLAEMGRDVVVLLDSLTRLGRAFNVAPNIIGTGKTLSGGLDAGALGVPKQLFGAARRFEEGGSLTIIATALVDTGSRGDQVIFEEFKGTGNMELILDRRIAEQRLFPAMDLAASGTRNDQKLMSVHELETVTALRRRLLSMPPPQQMEQLLKAVARYKTNADLVGDPNSVAKA